MIKRDKPLDNEVECWAFGTGRINPLMKRSRQAVEYIKSQPGFIGVHFPEPKHSLWIFDDENNAKKAKNLAEAKGIVCGKECVKMFVEKQYIGRQAS